MKSAFLLLLAGIIPTVQAGETQPVYAGVEADLVRITFSGQVAKDIFDALPDDSKFIPTKNCHLSDPTRTLKVRGGFVCSFIPGISEPYNCYLNVSAKTGSVEMLKKTDFCAEQEQP